MNNYRAVNLPDCYRILNVTPGAAWNEVRRAYHALALRFHPDRNLGDPFCEERFKEVSSAFQMLRRHYAAKGMADLAQDVPYPPSASSPRHAQPRQEGAIYEGTRRSRAWQTLKQWERRWFQLDVELKVVITRQVALNGGMIKVKRSWETLDIRVPQRSREGTLLRLQGKGDPGVLHRERGDLIVRIEIASEKPGKQQAEEYPVVVFLDKREVRQRRVFSLDTHEGEILYSLPVTTRHGQAIVLLGKSNPVTGVRTRFLVEVRLV